MEYNSLLIKLFDDIAVISVNRPDSLNALNYNILEELNDLLDKMSSDIKIRALIITGEGKSFVAGADISEMKSKNPEEASVMYR